MRSPKTTIVQQSVPIAEPAPPVSRQAEDVVRAGMEIRQQELVKKNVKSTVRAGETGGFKKANPLKGAPNESMMAAGAGAMGKY